MNVLDDLKNKIETVWINPDVIRVNIVSEINGIKYIRIKAAQNRLMRFFSYIKSAYPETAPKAGVIESELLEADELVKFLKEKGLRCDFPEGAKVFIKDDAHLPIAGSVKARGGIYEVLRIAEELALKNGLIKPGDDFAKFDSAKFKKFFSKYTIEVGSTGNLGLSVGISASRLGFNVVVHMSCDAREWKKNLLRKHGVTVKEYEGDYTEAVARGREESADNPMSIFIDDENSQDLFFGYSTAALRLKIQLFNRNIAVDSKHPLFVYIPCGVGGAPGGITFGLKQMYGDNVHCFMAEPVAAPCMTYALSKGGEIPGPISEIGLDCVTVADGLSVGKASDFVYKTVGNLVAGAFTVSDEKMLEYENAVYESMNLFIEPSACAGIHGLSALSECSEYEEYLIKYNLKDYMDNATHIIWATGGGLVPEEEKAGLLGGN